MACVPCEDTRMGLRDFHCGSCSCCAVEGAVEEEVKAVEATVEPVVNEGEKVVEEVKTEVENLVQKVEELVGVQPSGEENNGTAAQ